MRQSTTAIDVVPDPAGGPSIDDPIYSLATVSRCMRVPFGTVRWWTTGNSLHTPPIRIAHRVQRLLSFRNLIEIHMLKAIMAQDSNALPIPIIRGVLSGLGEHFGSEHPLADARMEAHGKDFLAASLGTLAHGSSEGYGKLAAVLTAHLQRIVRDEAGEPCRLLLFTRAGAGGPGLVMVDPRVRGGEPCITDSDVRTEVLAERFLSGMSLSDLAGETERTMLEIEEAIRYELAGS